MNKYIKKYIIIDSLIFDVACICEPPELYQGKKMNANRINSRIILYLSNILSCCFTFGHDLKICGQRSNLDELTWNRECIPAVELNSI